MNTNNDGKLHILGVLNPNVANHNPPDSDGQRSLSPQALFNDESCSNISGISNCSDCDSDKYMEHLTPQKASEHTGDEMKISLKHQSPPMFGKSRQLSEHSSGSYQGLSNSKSSYRNPGFDYDSYNEPTEEKSDSRRDNLDEEKPQIVLSKNKLVKNVQALAPRWYLRCDDFPIDPSSSRTSRVKRSLPDFNVKNHDRLFCPACSLHLTQNKRRSNI